MNIRIIREQGFEIKLDLSTQVLHLDIPEEWERGESEGQVEAELYPTIGSIEKESKDFVSASILVAKARQFDDGLYAAVEYLCQDGTEGFVDKRKLLQQVSGTLKEIDKEKNVDRGDLNYCRGLINAAADLGGLQITETDEVQKHAEEIKADFLSNQLRSKPIGFYTWTNDLSNIFKQDRLLQKGFESEDENKIRLLARALSENSNILSDYQAYLSFVRKLTNPFPPEYCDLSQIQDIQSGKSYCFFPPSQAHETQLAKRLYGNKPVPDGFSLIDLLIQKIRKREIDLTPKDSSGWCDHQVYALGPFVNPGAMPETSHLNFSVEYKKELIDLFKATIALTRETHIKQLEVPELTGPLDFSRQPIIKIYPEVSVEPVATFYLRRAESYSFVKKLLESTFGQVTLKNTYRLTASGKVSTPLWEELLNMEALFYGTYQVAAEEIGMEIGSQIQEGNKSVREADKQFARNWISTFADDVDVGIDNRMMVPVFYDIMRKKTKVWVALGYSAKPLSISFRKGPKVIDITGTKNKSFLSSIIPGRSARPGLEFEGIHKQLIYPVSAEVYVDELLDRDEFRALCDKHKTRSAILEAL